MSKIEWTDRTWNPLTGCTKVSPGCDHCYAKTMHERFNGPGSFDTVQLHPGRLGEPLRWRKPSLVFVNSMSDLFHPDVPTSFIYDVFGVMARTPQHTYQILTKRPARMRSLMRGVITGWANPLPNVWLGVSVEDQKWADIRIPALLDTPAVVRFLSCEPLLGPVTFRWAQWQPFSDDPTVGTNHLDGLRRLDWVIAGGESGTGARLMRGEWVRTIRDQCVEAGVPFLFKQWGAWAPAGRIATGVGDDPREAFGEVVTDGKYLDLVWRSVYRRVGKKAAGRELDGRTWDEYPERTDQPDSMQIPVASGSVR